jgi:hypothetical protein
MKDSLIEDEKTKMRQRFLIVGLFIIIPGLMLLGDLVFLLVTAKG